MSSQNRLEVAADSSEGLMMQALPRGVGEELIASGRGCSSSTVKTFLH